VVAPVTRLRVVLANCAYGDEFKDPDALLARYHSLTGWADALVGAGADSVTVVQRFGREARIRRGGVDYQFIADGESSYPAPWFLGRRVTSVIRGLSPSVVDVKGLVFPAFVRFLRCSLPRQCAIFVRDHGGFNARSLSFRSWRGRAFYRFGLRAADGFLFTSRDQATPWLRASIVASAEAIHEIPEASTDLRSGSHDVPAQRSLPGQPALLWVGRLDANKDPLTVLEGFAGAAPSLPDAQLTMVYGDDVLLGAVEARIAARPALRARVHLRGRMARADLPALYAAADIFVLGSHHEVACFSLIEALSFGAIPIVTDIPPFRVLTDAGRLGALFTPGNADQLAGALRRAASVDLPSQRRRVRAHFDDQLSWQAIGRKALAAYRAAAVARRSAA
jgi:glycosyltransferase involved in cell wall biosynthesis